MNSNDKKYTAGYGSEPGVHNLVVQTFIQHPSKTIWQRSEPSKTVAARPFLNTFKTCSVTVGEVKLITHFL